METRTYAEIRQQIADLQRQADQMLAQEKAQALAQVRELVRRYDLSQEAVFPTKTKRGRPSRKQPEQPQPG